MNGGGLLYIHPNGHLNDLVVPAGALTNLNSVPVPKLGRYAFEVEDDEIRAARVIAVDLHWALALTGFQRLIPHIRRVHPTVPIVVGGVTAGHYANEILTRFDVDYVLRGDSEASFERLIAALFEDREPEPLPNLHVRGLPPPAHRRMTAAEFDATDPLTADWFPTYSSVSNWNAAAFPQGRTITVSRGCAFVCPECYGSYASIYGSGYLLRSAQGLAKLLTRASEMGLYNLRLFVAKPPPLKFSQLLRDLAGFGPFSFRSTVGLYLCTPPSREDLSHLEQIFDCEVVISMIPPDEHVPALRPQRLEIEEDGWRDVAGAVRNSPKLSLDAWTTNRGDFERTRAMLGAAAQHPRVKVSFGSVWSVTRPTDSGEQHSYEEVDGAVRSLWTFYAARLLSPALNQLLQPFRYLDELDLDPETLTPPLGACASFFEQIMTSWRQHHLAMIPSLRLAVVSITATAPPAAPSPDGMRLRGDLEHIPAGGFRVESEPTPLNFDPDHRGIRMLGELPPMHGGSHLAIIPEPVDDTVLDNAWIDAISAPSLVALRIPAGDGAAADARIEILLRVQDAQVLLHRAATVCARGRSDIRYFRPVGH